jgi:hypothetical protein
MSDDEQANLVQAFKQLSELFAANRPQLADLEQKFNAIIDELLALKANRGTWRDRPPML